MTPTVLHAATGPHSGQQSLEVSIGNVVVRIPEVFLCSPNAKMAPPSDDMISTPPEQPSSAAMAPSPAPSESTANQDELSASPDESSTTSSHPEVGSVRDDLDDLDDQREWGIKGIIGHRADPDDDTRVQLKIDWEPSDGKTWDKTWEPEAIIQQDAPDMWAAYTKNHD